MLELWHIVFYQPIFNALIALYNTVAFGDIGIAIVILTLCVKIVLFPFSRQALASQKALAAIQPKIDAVKREHKDDKEALSRAIMGIYSEHKVNPAASCLPLVIQLPIFIALYQVLIAGLASRDLGSLYGFVANPGTINTTAFGFINLAAPSVMLALVAGIAQFFQARQMTHMQQPAARTAGASAKDETMLAMMNKQMLYVMPVMTVVIGISLPAGLSLYWCITNILTIAQQYILMRPTS